METQLPKSYLDYNYDRNFEKIREVSLLDGLSALDFQALIEDQSVTSEKIASKTTTSPATAVVTTQGITSDLLKLDSGDYAVLGSMSLKGVKIYTNIVARWYVGSNFPIVPNVWTAIPFLSSDYDPKNIYNNTTGFWTLPVKGIYLIQAAGWLDAMTDNKYGSLGIWKNGTYFWSSPHKGGTPFEIAKHISLTYIDSFEANDYLQIKVWHNMASSANLAGAPTNKTDRSYGLVHLLAAL